MSVGEESWHNGADAQIREYARSLRRAARTLGENWDPDSQEDVYPILLLYRQAMELELKALVEEGGNFLKVRPDPLSIYRTHSLRWLAQIVCQIVKAVGWESVFRCPGISDLAQFTAAIDRLESLDPVSSAVHRASVANARTLEKSKGREFLAQLEVLLNLLGVTTDSLRAAREAGDNLEAGKQGRREPVNRTLMTQ